MTNPLKLQEIRCPSCNAELTKFDPYSTKSVCEYCGSVINITTTLPKEMEEFPEKLIPVLTSSDDFTHTILHRFLEEQYIPNDIFDTVQFENRDAYYLPFYLFEGTFTSSWNCEVGHRESRNRFVIGTNGRERSENYSVTVWNPSGGTAQGNYSFICLAHNGEGLPDDLASYVTQFRNFPSEIAKPFDPAYLQNPCVIPLPANLNGGNTWSASGLGYVYVLGQQECEAQLASFNYRNLNVSTAFNQKHDGKLIYLPFWFTHYTYKDETYYMVMSGWDERLAYGTYPTDTERVTETKSCYKTSNTVGIAGCFITALLGITILMVSQQQQGVAAGITLAAAVVFLIIYAWLKNAADNEVKEILDVNRDIRLRKMQTLHDRLSAETLEKYGD